MNNKTDIYVCDDSVEGIFTDIRHGKLVQAIQT